MTGPAITTELTALVRQFFHDARAKIAELALDGSAEEIVDRVAASISALAAGVMMAWPKTREHIGVIGALLAFAMRMFGKKRVVVLDAAQ
jgi:hypothetical protein